ncbi:MAG: hypothetical protein HQ454_05220 [Acidimicrobiaceae bacterium]|nr:hypothetical protein [Acidimicrobiaceae bacterium]
MKKLLLFIAAISVVLPTSTAKAHDPIILTANQRTSIDGPLLPDGTISFALYGSLESAGDTRGFRVEFNEGDALALSLLIPDLPPENSLDKPSLPYLEVVDPDGIATQVLPTARVSFAEPFTGTNYVRLAELVGVAKTGLYSITIAGAAATRFTVSIGDKEMFGTPVENVPNRSIGVTGVMAWYETPPLAAQPTPQTTASPAVGDTSTVGASRSSRTLLMIEILFVAIAVVGSGWQFARSRRRSNR